MPLRLCKMKTSLISLVLIFTLANWANGAGLPILPQASYFVNGTVKWFPQIIDDSAVQLAYTRSQVSIQNRVGYHLCSGTLISLKTILTAASCLLNQNGKRLHPSEVISGDTNLVGEKGAGLQIRDIQIYYIRSISGIAILELFNSFIEMSTLKYRQISNDAVTEGQICYVVGWGASPLTTNIRLQKVPIKILDNAVANSSKYYDSEMPRGTISTVSLSNGCFGDLGGALICDNAFSGILSFGYGCKRPDFPLVFYQTYDDDVIQDSNRRGGGSGGSSGGGSNGGSSGGSGGGIHNPGGESNNEPKECNKENEEDCNGTVVKNLSLTALLFPILQYFFVKFVN